jgi:hypothetical protein
MITAATSAKIPTQIPVVSQKTKSMRSRHDHREHDQGDDGLPAHARRESTGSARCD